MNNKPFLISLVLRPQPLAEQQARCCAGLQGGAAFKRFILTKPCRRGLPRVSHLWQRSAVRVVAGWPCARPCFLPCAARFLGNLSSGARGNLGQGRQGHGRSTATRAARNFPRRGAARRKAGLTVRPPAVRAGLQPAPE